MERRASGRLPIVLKVLIYNAAGDRRTRSDLPAHEFPIAVGNVVDLSEGGLLLETDLTGLQPGVRIELDLLLQNAGVESHAHCRLAVSRRTESGYALSVDPACAFSGEILSLLHRRDLRFTGRVPGDARHPVSKNGRWWNEQTTSAA